MSVIIPPYLREGDKIGIVCPAGYMAYEKSQTAIKILEEWGYVVRTGSTIGNRFNYFSGTDKQRLDDLQQMMDDHSIRAIFCARGGYGLGRIIEQLNFKKMQKKPKWVIGFSDITVLHSHLYARYKIASLHAPMASAFNDGGYRNSFVQSLRKALSGEKINYHCTPHPFNRHGKATGRLVGGNLSLLAHLTGTSSEVKFKNKILFIEDVGEYIYNVDRMLYQLKRSQDLRELAGVIVGGFTEMKDTTTPYGQSVEEVIRDIFSEYRFPVCFNFPVSHGPENYALKVGTKYTFNCNDMSTTLQEI